LSFKRHLNLIITPVLFVVFGFLVYMLSLDKTEGHRGIGEAHFQAGELDAAIAEFEISLELDPGNDGAQSRIYDCYYKQADIAFNAGGNGLLKAEKLLKWVDGGEFLEDAEALTTAVTTELNKEVTVEAGRRVIDAYTKDLPDPPEDWEVGDDPLAGYKYIIEDTVTEETITKRQFLTYPDQYKIEIIDEYAAEINASKYMVIPGHLLDESPIDLAVNSFSRTRSVKLDGGATLDAEENKFMYFVNVSVTNIGDEPYELALENCRIYKTLLGNYSGPFGEELDAQRDQGRSYLPDTSTIAPGETLTGNIMFYDFTSDYYYFKIVMFYDDPDSDVPLPKNIVGKCLPTLTNDPWN